MKAVNLRELKNRLGGYVAEVRAGEVILVTNRGQVVAELRQPLHDQRVLGGLEETLDRLAREGKLRIGLTNTPEVYVRSSLLARDGLVEELIDADRSPSPVTGAQVSEP
jgi:antitoxin (DNA-binding transcriptional repressor) of toxin-antitoxin stability system